MSFRSLDTELSGESLSQNVYRAEQVRLLEPQAAENLGFSMFEIMQQAGQSLFDWISAKYTLEHKILVVVGTGNNGGDGYIAATQLRIKGYSVTLCSSDPAKILSGDAHSARQLYEQQGFSVEGIDDVDFTTVDLIVDALLGTGLTGEVRAPFDSIIARINASPAKVLAVDIPSGVHADTGVSLGSSVDADFTQTFVAIKPGLITGQGKSSCGQLTVAPLAIGSAFPALQQPFASKVNFDNFSSLKQRKADSHKGNHGRLLCIGGNKGMAGAMRLSAEAALRCGAGLVKVFCHDASQIQVSQGRPEIMLTSENLHQALHWADCIVFGPGLGQDSWSQQIFSQLLSYLIHEDKPIIIDADGLNLLSKHLHKFHLTNLIVTPHAAEAARMLNMAVGDVDNDRYGTVQALHSRYQAHSVLKGAGTLIQNNQGLFVCGNGNPGMATGGMGDVLSGVLGSLMAQGMTSSLASLYGTCLHSAAADLAANKCGQRGMIASDVIAQLRPLVN
ncbi:NAD(P)H-hydrate dehydratase [Aliiglaciecola sp. LCG003]|uniref:NAD(P)H-hydrate dehydratase n=1 Tax=Aliiglaciecola sp. LCG003 TaxID=3053655 RepID=UPI0025739F82|nr:NAD(P)H-hydrate dehydratase [Aliiglaciecola sp. LCG003]WJG09787.1 NAD(P)H-hydrate dehydratase [Aliiglaciecola sp. LCG003]